MDPCLYCLLMIHVYWGSSRGHFLVPLGNMGMRDSFMYPWLLLLIKLMTIGLGLYLTYSKGCTEDNGYDKTIMFVSDKSKVLVNNIKNVFLRSPCSYFLQNLGGNFHTALATYGKHLKMNVCACLRR